MDDLLGEDWQSSSKQPSLQQPLNAASFASNYSSLRATPQPSSSAASSTFSISRPSSTAPVAQKAPAKPTTDAFGGLTGFKSSKTNGAGLSIQERQRQIAEEKHRQAREQGLLWDTLGASKAAAKPANDSEDDILAAFNKDAKVDRSSHFPPPSLPASDPVSRKDTPSSVPAQQYGGFDDDDDTFGLSGLAKSNGQHTTRVTTRTNDDDILGDLSRPVQPKQAAPLHDSDDERWDENVAKGRNGVAAQQDTALSELTEMGFPEETARIALAENDGDVQRSVGWLLQQAHEESKQKAREQRGERASPTRNGRSPARRPQDESVPSWLRQDARASSNGRPSQPASDKDASQIAQEFGSKLFKSANSLWKAGQKQVAKTVADFQQERNPAQPKWMQSEQSSRDTSQRRPENGRPDVTNEAALLDMPRDGPPPRPAKATQPISRDRSPLAREQARASPVPAFQDRRPASKLSRQDVEEQSAQAYVSPARRKTKPKPEPVAEPEVDLFSPMPSRPAAAPAPQPSRSAAPLVKAAPRPKVTRTIPAVSAIALAASAKHRERGTEAFKRGDYGTAHEAYSAALSGLPATHPLLVVVLTNRSLTALKTGDAKMAVSDADRAIEIIGPGCGIDETIEIDSTAAPKDMREFYGKALMRKAEALEHMEKWSDAASVWRLAVEAGVGGAVSIRGRDRCEKAANPAPKAAGRPSKPAARPPPAKALGNSIVRPALTTPTSDAAVKKLREANAAADRADDEKFQLADQVDARLSEWKNGKADNLRALLQSMDTVLWESAGWRKVGMSDLVMPNKVKIVYMKAIGKVHPDKVRLQERQGRPMLTQDQLPQDASVEQRMISGAVFSVLNEAWDKFKKDNNL